MKLLLSEGVAINAADGTILSAAVVSGDPKVLKVLVEKGADPNAKGIFGVPLFMEAADAGNLDVVRALLGAGADVNVRDSAGMTSLMTAVSDDYLAKMHRLPGVNMSKGRDKDGNKARGLATRKRS